MIILLVSGYDPRSFKKLCRVNLQTGILRVDSSSSIIRVRLLLYLSTKSGNSFFTEFNFTLAPRPEAIERLEYLLSACYQLLSRRTIINQFTPVIRDTSFIECCLVNSININIALRLHGFRCFYTILPTFAFLLLINLYVSYIFDYDIYNHY